MPAWLVDSIVPCFFENFREKSRGENRCTWYDRKHGKRKIGVLVIENMAIYRLLNCSLRSHGNWQWKRVEGGGKREKKRRKTRKKNAIVKLM